MNIPRAERNIRGFALAYSTPAENLSSLECTSLSFDTKTSFFSFVSFRIELVQCINASLTQVVPSPSD
ncbi:hypothetical protein CEXT_188491 [Caerostris extrusa]|uniref:Uncharacterized protein n=1 Tax=Caerostris extrusa TaxID=172846 RepID=A0AAV4U9X3_CAEEX|nr:hypothetical protein CEXT_188491 [Caerostris extrusa]